MSSGSKGKGGGGGRVVSPKESESFLPFGELVVFTHQYVISQQPATSTATPLSAKSNKNNKTGGKPLGGVKVPSSGDGDEGEGGGGGESEWVIPNRDHFLITFSCLGQYFIYFFLEPNDLVRCRYVCAVLAKEMERIAEAVVFRIKRLHYKSTFCLLPAKAEVGSQLRYLAKELYVRQSVVLLGGEGDTRTTPANKCTLLDVLDTNRANALPNMIRERDTFCAFLLYGEIFVVSGGPLPLGEGVGYVERYDVLMRKWSSKTRPLPLRAMRPSTAVLNDEIFVIGGLYQDIPMDLSSPEAIRKFYEDGVSAEIYSDIVFKYHDAQHPNMGKGYWTELPTKLLKGRFGHASIAFNGKIYVTGGACSRATVLQTCEVYDPATGIWTEGKPMLTRRFFHTLLVARGELYAVAGDSDDERFSREGFTIEKMDTQTGVWQHVTMLAQSRSGCCACCIGSIIYVFGGRDKQKEEAAQSWVAFDVETNQWRMREDTSEEVEVKSLPRSFSFGAALVFPENPITWT